MSDRSCDDVAPECPYNEKELLQATEDLGITKDQSTIRNRWKRQTEDWRRQYNSYDYSYESDPYYYNLYENKHQNYVRKGNVHHRAPTKPHPLNNNRRQSGVLGGMPPIFRPRDAGAREVCRTCDVRGNVCSVYGIGNV